MGFTTGDYIQLIVALGLGIALFVVAYGAPSGKVLTVVLLLIPFQFVASRYGSGNMVIVYLVTAAFLLRGEIQRLPLLAPLLLVVFAYLLSLAMAPPETYRDHILYLINWFAGILLFFLVYNQVRGHAESPAQAFLPFYGIAFLVAGYSLVQLALGVKGVPGFGVGDLAFGANLLEKQRLVGPFGPGSAGTNGEFYALQVLLLGYGALYERRKRLRLLLGVLVFVFFGLVIATGSRGSALSLAGGCVLFFILFWRDLGLKRVLSISGIAGAGFATATVLILIFTPFNVLFDRLQGTQLEGGVPDTRIGTFELALERIPERWIVGHGPRVRLIDQDERTFREVEPLGNWPHNLYLHLLFSLGVVGLGAYLVLFAALLWRWWGEHGKRSSDSMLDGVPKLAVLLMIMFLVDQLKIEFLRDLLSDYKNYVFALWGMLLGLTDQLGARVRGPVEEAARVTEAPLSTAAPALLLKTKTERGPRA